jgi:Tol biopolymer transport system component
MTFDRHGNSSPSFSPTGEKLLFLSDREEDSQLGQMPADGRSRKSLF